MIKKALLIGDPHSSPDTDNERFSWVGNLILEEDPELVICIGDFADLNSLSSYDKGKRSAELRRYRSDVNACRDALTRIDEPLLLHNEKKKNIRKAQRQVPRKVMILGNHEHRITRAVDQSPELEGTLSIDDLGYKEFGWEVYPFRRTMYIEGVAFCHFFPSGVKGEPISGFNIASNVISKNMVSSVCGHSHLWDHAIRSRPDGSQVVGLCCGWYGVEPTFDAATEQLWWSGVTLLHDMNNGSFDLSQIGISRVKELYS